MPSLVFVRDAQEHPLMPMSAAYARRLLQQGKAHLRPHPTFTIIELTQVVKAPTLRPVLIGLDLSRRRAELQVLIDQARTLPASFSIALELPSYSDSIHSRRRSWQPQKMRTGNAVHAQVISQLRHIVEALSVVVNSLQQLLPISHWSILLPQTNTALSNLAHRRIRRLLNIRLSSSAQQRPVHEIDLSSASKVTTLPKIAQPLLTRTNNRAPMAAARVNQARTPVNRPFQLSTIQRIRQHNRKLVQRRNIGQVCSVRSGRRTFTGIVSAVHPDDQFVLQVPVLSSGEYLHWRSIAVSADTPTRIWPSSRVALLPLSGTFQS